MRILIHLHHARCWGCIVGYLQHRGLKVIKASQYFTGHGMLGVVFFVLGNLGSAWALADLMHKPAYEAVSFGNVVPLLLFSVFGLISVPMMLIGRAYDMKITEIPKDFRKP
jgi:hypothetical protein